MKPFCLGLMEAVGIKQIARDAQIPEVRFHLGWACLHEQGQVPFSYTKVN